MSGLFRGMLDSDSPVILFLTRVFDLMLLNLLALLCAVPVLTAGAALTALYGCLLHMARKEDQAVLRTFFRSFQSNFRQGTALFWILVSLCVVLVESISRASVLPVYFCIVVTAVLIVLLLSDLALFLYAFPLLARYENTLPAVIHNALAIAVTNLPQTAGMLAILFLSALSAFLLPIELAAPIGALFGVSFPLYLCAKMTAPILFRLEQAQK